MVSPMWYGLGGILPEKMLGLRTMEQEEFGGAREARGLTCMKAQGPGMAILGWRNAGTESFDVTLKTGCIDLNLSAERDLKDWHVLLI